MSQTAQKPCSVAAGKNPFLKELNQRMYYKKQDVSYFDWARLNKTLDKELLKAEGIPNIISWLLPQTLAVVGNHFPVQRNDGGLISAQKTIELIIQKVRQSAILLGSGKPLDLVAVKNMFKLLRHAPRGDILGGIKQISVEGSRYSTAVPLILSAFREHRGIQYSEWDFEDEAISTFVEPNILAMAPFFNTEFGWSVEQLLEFRETGRLIKSGVNQGTMKSIQATTTITGVQDPGFRALPALAKTLLCQTWVYAPHLRHTLAITNLQDIDSASEPLLDTDLLSVGVSTARNVNLDDVWGI